MNKKIRKPIRIRRDVRKLGEGVNTFKKRHLLREAPDGIEYSVEGANWTEECNTWEEARDKLSKLITPKGYRMLMLSYTENAEIIDTILNDVLESYEYTPLLFKWVVESVENGDILYTPAEDAEEFFESGNFSMEDFPEYFDYEGWFYDFKNGYISDNNGFEIYESPDETEYAIDTDALISDADSFLSANS